MVRKFFLNEIFFFFRLQNYNIFWLSEIVSITDENAAVICKIPKCIKFLKLRKTLPNKEKLIRRETQTIVMTLMC